MKYGVLYYKDTDNIGDDIQSYASARFLPKIDYYIDREGLETFVPKKKEQVKTIMNAWYIHDKFNFDISPYITPLYISMFLKRFPYEAGVTIDDKYINKNILETFKVHGPIGTRDEHTKKILDKFKIENYFSGCMTLTLNKLPNIKKEDYIVTVGLNEEEIEHIKKQTNRKVIKFVQDVKKGSFSNESWQQRKERVEDVLKLYQGAHFVITTKLHCSLPCLALGTPVLLLYDTSFAENKDRIGTYITYLNYVKREEFLRKDIDFENPKPNQKKHLDIRKSLEKTCSEFVNSIVEKKALPEIKEYQYCIEKSRNMRELPIEELKKLQSIYEKECKKSSEMYDKIRELTKKNERLEQEYNNTLYQYHRTIDYKVKTTIQKGINKFKKEEVE